MTQRLALYLLLAGCALLSAVIFGELDAAMPDDPAAMPAPAQAAAEPARPEVQPRADQLLAIALARPLFDPKRRPLETVGNTTAAPELTDARLTGIVIEPGRGWAIFDMTGGKPLTLGEGETVSGWRIDSIGPREVSLSGPGGTRTLQPKADPGLAARAGAAPAGAGQGQTPLVPAALPPGRPAPPPRLPPPRLPLLRTRPQQ